jgi:hypothetical protein
MNFVLDYKIRIDGNELDSRAFAKDIATYKSKLADVGALEGAIVMQIDGKAVCGEQYDPIVRLLGQWVGKIPWILAGDTETVALRHSEHCFAFVPAGESVEISFFVGSESEVDEYIVEPTTVRLEAFATETLKMAERVVEMIRAAEPSLLERHEDVRDLMLSLADGRKAWRDHQLHNRR